MLQLELYSAGNKKQKQVIIGPLNRVHVIWGAQIDLLFPNYEIPAGYPAEAFDELGDVKALYICTSGPADEHDGAVEYNGQFYSDFSIAQYKQTASAKGEL